MDEYVVVRDEFNQVIYDDVIFVTSEEDLGEIYSLALRFNAKVYRYSGEYNEKI